MASNPTPPSRGGMVSLYADLLDSSNPSTSKPSTTISRAPVVFKRLADEDTQQDEISLQKQHINAGISSQRGAARPAVKSTIADWTATGDDEDVNGFYGGEKRQRGGRKKRKKNREESHAPQNWDDVYDPSRPNNYEEYKHSDEKVLEVMEWKNRLYRHRFAQRQHSDLDSEEDEQARPQSNNMFTPSSNLSFAPPPNLGGIPAALPDAPTGEGAYAQRMRSRQAQEPVGSSKASSPLPPPPPSYSPVDPVPLGFVAVPSPPPLPQKPLLGTISRAPVRYNLPSAAAYLPTSEAELQEAIQREELEDEADVDDAPRSLRPGQRGFAERLMLKHGWTKGSGLGASGSGIVNPLRVQVEKQKKKPDAEGGGFVGPGGRGKIIGGKKKVDNAGDEEGRFGAMSEVVVLRGMVDGLDLAAELEGAGDGGIMQEIGEECSEKYGRVERVFIDRSSSGSAPVFVKFTSQLSALRAVNALEGRIFNGNAIAAKFFETDKFERGIYD
ncbi:MAG: hypothetical protein M1827_005406 [Pycnora praestabilis]|nr:MAG: hypothetical protein M1827_005406 [Pycnora praestabilis]